MLGYNDDPNFLDTLLNFLINLIFRNFDEVRVPNSVGYEEFAGVIVFYVEN